MAKHGEIAHLKTTEEEGRGAPVWTERWALMDGGDDEHKYGDGECEHVDRFNGYTAKTWNISSNRRKAPVIWSVDI